MFLHDLMSPFFLHIQNQPMIQIEYSPILTLLLYKQKKTLDYLIKTYEGCQYSIFFNRSGLTLEMNSSLF